MASPNQIETAFFPEASATSAIKNADENRQTRRSFQNLPPIPEYAAALFVEGNDVRLRFWLFPEAE
jgi:hypothetical protein